MRAGRLLVVAAPMVSRGGVYSYLGLTLPRLQAIGWEIGVLWGLRGEAPPPAGAAWSRRWTEPESLRGRVTSLASGVRAAIDEWSPDVVLSVLPQADLACALATYGTRCRWVAMAHGRPVPASGEAGRMKRALWVRSLRCAYRRVDRMVAVSRALAMDLVRVVGVHDAEVIHNGVELHNPYPANSPPSYGYIGRLSKEKGVDRFLEVAAHIPGRRAHVYGDGPERASVIRAAATSAALDYGGWTDRDTAFRNVDVLVVSSRREALSLTSLEAGARGRVVVAWPVGGIPEILGQDRVLEKHCLLRPDASPAEAAYVIEGLLSDEDLRQELAYRLRSVVADRFRIEDAARRLGEVLGLTN